MIKKILLALLAIFLIMQFFRADLPEVIQDNPEDLIANNEVPADVEHILRSSCYDCHSNETNYPWYSYVAPVSYLVAEDTEHGRRDLNFSTWESLDKIEKAEMLHEIAEEVEEGEMPMKIYTYTHSEARLSDEQREMIEEWAEEMAESLFE